MFMGQWLRHAYYPNWNLRLFRHRLGRYVYVWQRGFLDGRAGYHFARLHGFYEYLCVVKTRELKRQRELAHHDNGAGNPNDRIPRS